MHVCCLLYLLIIDHLCWFLIYIQILITDFNPYSNEYDFKKALDLLYYVPQVN